MSNKFTAVILAGGKARRMDGEDKGLMELNDKPMIEYIIDALREQADAIMVNANRNIEVYERYGYPVVPDLDEGFKGPLAGMASCMQKIEAEYMLTLPCDSPMLSPDYAKRMLEAQENTNAEICVADSGERMQPVFCLLDCKLLPSLTAYLESGERKIDRWFEQHRLVKVDFSDQQNMFANVNTPEELRYMEKELARETT